MTASEPGWLGIVRQKRTIQSEALQAYSSGPSPIDKVTDIDDIRELSASIVNRELTAVEVVSAYCSSLTEVLFNDALQRAQDLDNYMQEHGGPVGPLHGIPITLKDQFDVKDHDSTLGYVGRAFQPADEDAVLVGILKQLGAVIIAKTNLPQSIMWVETENPLWGLTTHPQNPSFTPGGSSGGEAALLAMHGSPVGWGTDLGGSIRMPAHLTGVYGFRPSSGRLPYFGAAVSTEGQEHVPSVIGPLARSLSTIHLITKLIIDAAPWRLDPRCHPLLWREEAHQEVQSRPLVVGLLLDDGIVKVHPPIERILKEVADRLRKSGHEVIPWDASGHRECVDIMDAYFTADGGEDVRRHVAVAGEPYIPHVEALVNRAPAISVYEYWQLNRRKVAAQKAYLDRWNSARAPSGRGVDVLLTPTMAHVAVPHRKCRWVGYTKVWNLLDYAAVSVPAGRVDGRVDPRAEELTGYEPRNELDRWNWELYDLESMKGMPVGVQVVGKRLEEEKVLGAAMVVDELIRGG